MPQLAVPNHLTRQELLRMLRACKLLNPFDIDRLDEAHSDLDAARFGEKLVAAGTLTAYQLESICQGLGNQLLIGNYEVLDRLGAGGMGTVYKARHRRMKRIVALKVLSRDLSSDSNFVQRFQREVETIARLSHPNIVMAFDADEAEIGHFLVMEYINGRDLASLVQRQGPFDVKTAVECVLQAARGLDYAHQQGIIHRDIKPANLLRDSEGVVKVTDLGLARFNTAGAANANAQTTDSSLTKVGSIMGTADYMPPEQAIDAAATDHRADIYSLGGTLHFLLLGHGPYSGGNLMTTLLNHREAPIPVLSRSRHDVPPQLDEVFRRMLGKQPHERQQKMAEVVAELEAVLATPKAAVATSASSLPDTLVLPPTPAASDSAKMLNILLVEPSRTQAGIIRKYLQSIAVAQITVFATGREALQQLRSANPDAIVCAMHLDDMTGAELAMQVRSAHPAKKCGFVLISSQGDTHAVESLGKWAFGVTLRKPFNVAELVDALKLSSPALAWLKPPSSTPAASQVLDATLLAPAGAPLRAPPASQVIAATLVSPARLGKLRVLIVDDSAAARVHERSVLQTLGFTQFVEAADGAQAVAAVCKENIDLIITDYNMPLMDGSGLVGFIKQNPSTASVPIIMVTTETDPAKLAAVRKLGVLAICDKSFPAETVRSIINTVF